MVQKKGTLLIESGPVHHLHIICSEPAYFPEKGKDCFLCVNISTVSELTGYDASCVLQAGDHPFIHHASYVCYDRAAVFGLNTVQLKLDEGEIKLHAPCSERMFNSVMAGFDVSNFVEPKILRFIERYC